MSTPISFNGVSYTVPAYNDTGYAQGPGNLSSYLIAIASGTLQQSGGTFSLTADVNFGLNFGLIAKYLTSESSGTATAGMLRLAHNDIVAWRNAAGNGNLNLTTNGSDQLTFNGAVVQTGTGFVTSITGTANQVIASASTGAVTLSTPQNIGTASDVTFRTLTLSGNVTTGLVLGGTNVGISNVGAFGISSGSSLTLTGTPITANGELLPNTDNGSNLGSSSKAFANIYARTGLQLLATGGGANAISLAPPSSITSYTLTLPSAQGSNHTTLHNDGSGNLTFNLIALSTDVSGTLPVANGGTGNTTFTAYSVICAGTTATGLFQNVSGVGSSGQVLTSNGAATLPTWQTLAGTGTVNSGTAGQFAYYATSTNAVSGNTLATISGGIVNLGSASGGNLGEVVMFSPTSAKGNLSIGASDNAGNSTILLTNASQAGNRTYSVPDAGASANFVMSEGAATVNGVKTFGSSPIVPNATTATQAAAFGQIKVFQTVMGTSTASDTTTSVTFTNTSLSVTITPTSASSKILLHMTGTGQCPATNSMFLTLANNTTNLLSSNGGVRMNSAAIATEASVALTYLDSPATTSAITYRVRFMVSGGTGQFGDANITNVLIAQEVQ